MRKALHVTLAIVLLYAGAILLDAQQTPLTPFMQLQGHTDSNGNILVSLMTLTGAQGPLTPLANLPGRTDANGNLLMAFGTGAGSIGADTQVIFNDGGVLAGNSQMTYAKGPGALTVSSVNANTSNMGVMTMNPTLFANLATPGNGTFRYCSDCVVAATCAGAGTGAFAKRLNNVWVCN